MDIFIRGTPQYHQMYIDGCSKYNISSIPIELRQHIPLGLAFITLGVIEQCNFINSIITGFFGMTGVVYCTYPNVIYVLGGFALGFWCCESTVEVLLAVNRCVEICSPRFGKLFFRGWRTWLWMIPPTAYGIYVFFFTEPVIFSGTVFSWFFNPHLGYLDDKANLFHNDIHKYHNYILIVMIVLCYGAFGLILFIKSHAVSKQTRTSRSHMKIFVQVILISTINAIAAAIFAMMQYVQITELLIIIAQFTWFQAHGFPPIIYLSLNKTIRTDCINMILRMFGIDRVKMLSAKGRSMFPSEQRRAPSRARVAPKGIAGIFNLGTSTGQSISGGEGKTTPPAGDGHNEIEL